LFQDRHVAAFDHSGLAPVNADDEHMVRAGRTEAGEGDYQRHRTDNEAANKRIHIA